MLITHGENRLTHERSRLAQHSGDAKPMSIFPAAADTALDVFSLLMILFSAQSVLKQELTRLFDAKSLLLMVHVFFAGIFVLDIPRAFVSSPDFMGLYTIGVTSLAIWTAILMTALAYVVSVRPSERTFGERVRALFTTRLFPHGIIIAVFTVYAMAIDLFVVLTRPYTLVPVVSWLGAATVLPEFGTTFLAMAAVLLAFFFVTSTTQFILAARRANNPSMRSTLAAFGGGWGVIAITIFVSRAYLVQAGLDAQGLGNLIIALVFGAFAVLFRRISALSSLFGPMKAPIIASEPSSEADLPTSASFSEDVMLLEVDPATNYEKAVLGFVREQLSKGKHAFVFTTKGSPVWMALHETPEVRFFLFGDTSYPQPGASPLEVLIPKADQAVILSVLDETVSRTPPTPTAIVFDNISDLIMNLGFEDSLKFLRQANEVQAGKALSSVFLLLSNAHDERVTTLVRSVFHKHLSFDADGLKVTRGS